MVPPLTTHCSFFLAMILFLFFHLSPFVYSERHYVLSAVCPVMSNLSWTLTGLVYESEMASWDPHTKDEGSLGLRAAARYRKYSGLKQRRGGPKEDIHSGR